MDIALSQDDGMERCGDDQHRGELSFVPRRISRHGSVDHRAHADRAAALSSERAAADGRARYMHAAVNAERARAPSSPSIPKKAERAPAHDPQPRVTVKKVEVTPRDPEPPVRTLPPRRTVAFEEPVYDGPYGGPPMRRFRPVGFGWGFHGGGMMGRPMGFGRRY